VWGGGHSSAATTLTLSISGPHWLFGSVVLVKRSMVRSRVAVNGTVSDCHPMVDPVRPVVSKEKFRLTPATWTTRVLTPCVQKGLPAREKLTTYRRREAVSKVWASAPLTGAGRSPFMS